MDGGVVGAGEIAFAGALDLDDAGAEIAEVAGAERAGEGLFEGEDGEAGERSGSGHGWVLQGGGMLGKW